MAAPSAISSPAKEPRGPYRGISAERRRAFLDTLKATGNWAEAAREASPHSATGAYNSFKSLADRDPQFAADCADAMHIADGELLKEARRRAIEGTLEPVFQKGQRVWETRVDPTTGKQVRVPASIRKYDSMLLQLLLRGRFKSEFGTKQIEHSGTIQHQHVNGADRSPQVLISRDELFMLPEAEQTEFLRILGMMSANRDRERAMLNAPSAGFDSIDAEFSEIEDTGEADSEIQYWKRSEGLAP